MTDPQTQQAIQEIMRHIAVLNDDYTNMSVSVATLTERLSWIVRFFWVLITAITTTAVASVFNLLFQVWKHVKSNKK